MKKRQQPEPGQAKGGAPFIAAHLFIKAAGISPTTACTGRYLNRLEEKKDQPHVQLEVTYHRDMKRRWYHINLKKGMTA